ncbi:MAG TPA: hypothetical protein VJ718_06925 [Candidatus Binataceae bacterium]|nr:hypothetical protein [Candidatus Binataceae bacterium]
MLAADTIDFIQSSIKSVWALRLLLLLRDKRDRVWKIGELTRKMRASELAIKQALDEFARAFVIKTDNGEYCYRPATPELERMASELADAYARHSSTVIRAIVSAPNAKVQTFAEAFKRGKR